MLRNLALEAGQEQQLYRGLPSSDDTRTMLRKLATYMRSTGNPEDDDNDMLPAGYTYLAQLVAHDLLHNVLPLPGSNLEQPDATRDDLERDYRTNRLVLDTIYGGGPSIHPLAYVVRNEPAGTGLQIAPRRGARAGGGQRGVQTGRVPRYPPARCPHLNDAPSARGAPDALLADPRNDDNLILSQLTALFHELHNGVIARLPPRSGRDEIKEKSATPRGREDRRGCLSADHPQGPHAEAIEQSVYEYYSDAKRDFPGDFIFDGSHCDFQPRARGILACRISLRAYPGSSLL